MAWGGSSGVAPVSSDLKETWMPTGYTAPIEGDLTLAQYAHRVARSFLLVESGVDVLAPDAEIPLVLGVPDTYQERVYAAESDLSQLRGMTSREVVDASWGEKVQESGPETRQNLEARNAAYRAMLSQVEAWAAPDILLGRLKRFMLERIEASIYNLGDEISHSPASPGEWHADALYWARRDLKKAKELMREATETYADRNAFVASLYAEFPLDGDCLPDRKEKPEGELRGEE